MIADGAWRCPPRLFIKRLLLSGILEHICNPLVRGTTYLAV
jgi:hypothetical protein